MSKKTYMNLNSLITPRRRKLSNWDQYMHCADIALDVEGECNVVAGISMLLKERLSNINEDDQKYKDIMFAIEILDAVSDAVDLKYSVISSHNERSEKMERLLKDLNMIEVLK